MIVRGCAQTPPLPRAGLRAVGVVRGRGLGRGGDHLVAPINIARKNSFGYKELKFAFKMDFACDYDMKKIFFSAQSAYFPIQNHLRLVATYWRVPGGSEQAGVWRRGSRTRSSRDS